MVGYPSMKQPKKPRTDWIYGTTKDEVDEIGVEFSSDGKNAHFSQEMIDTFVETTYPREGKSPKVVTRCPTSGPDHPFFPAEEMAKYDYVVAVDSGWDKARKTSVTAVIKGDWNWVAEPDGLVRYIRPRPIFCFEFLEIEQNITEPIGWIAALEYLSQEEEFQNAKRVALIVDSQLDKLMAFNNRSLPLLFNRYLPKKVSMIHGSDKGGSLATHLIKLADSTNKQARQRIDEKDLPWKGCFVQGRPWKAFRKIRLRPISVNPCL